MVREEQGEGEVEQGIMVRKIKAGRRSWTVIGVHVNGDMERKMEKLRRWAERMSEQERLIVGGDFNARTGEEGGRVGGSEEEGEGGRTSNDKKINREGRKMIEVIEEVRWEIMNGNVKRDEEGEFTYSGGRGETVIDCVLGDEVVREEIERMVVEEKVDSDQYHPIVVTIKEGNGRRREKERKEKKRGGGKWTERMEEIYEREIRGTGERRGDIQETVEKVRKSITRAIEKCEKEGGREEKRKRGRGWWDDECKKKKREVRRELRKCRKGGGKKEGYRERKREYERMCERKKAKEQEKLIREVAEASTENEV